MSVQTYLDRWRADGIIDGEQHAVLGAMVRKERLSVFLELNALLYLGVVALIAGIGWTIREYVSSLGDGAILAGLTALLGACFYYCRSRAAAYSNEAVPSPTFAFDYILYLGCAVFAVELGYVEVRFHLLRDAWDYYLLASALAFFALAYRFDNRFVLALALSTLAAWFGVRLSYFELHVADTMRESALVYAGLVAASGLAMHRLGLKSHFVETYLHVAANAVFLSLVSGVIAGDPRWPWLLGLVAASAISVHQGVRFRRFVFVVYGVVYGYVGISAEILRHTSDLESALAYLVASAIAVIVSLVVMARRVGRDA